MNSENNSEINIDKTPIRNNLWERRPAIISKNTFKTENKITEESVTGAGEFIFVKKQGQMAQIKYSS